MHAKHPTPPSTLSKISFSSGDYRLQGSLHLPSGNGPFPLVIGSHGLLATGDSPKQIALADRLTRKGLAYFRFDHRGCGRSEGDLHTATSFVGRCQDLKCAASELLTRTDLRRPLGLFGSSFGGAISLGCATELNPAAIVTLAAPMASQGISSAAIADLLDTEPYPGALDREALKFDLSDIVERISHLLVIHGNADEVVSFDNAVRIHAAAQAPNKLLELADGDHRVSDLEHQQFFLSAAAAWFLKYVR